MICVKSDLASAAVILAHPDYCEDELGKQLAEVNKRGYDIRHLISLSWLSGDYSKGLESMIARLENGGYTHGEFFKDSRSLTEEGVGLLERVILEAFLENPGLTQRFSRDVGLNLNQILQKYVKEYLGMKEEHLYGRRFS